MKKYSMKEVCELTNLSYETLKFYCRTGLVTNVARDENSHRYFTESQLEWIKTIICLKKCGFSVAEMKDYAKLCEVDTEDTINRRLMMFCAKEEELGKKIAEIHESLDFIKYKKSFYGRKILKIEDERRVK